jgi:hypothetical protein
MSARRISHGVGVFVDVAVGGTGVLVHVAVGNGVFVHVAVGTGVLVRVAVGGAGVLVGVGVGVMVGLDPACICAMNVLQAPPPLLAANSPASHTLFESFGSLAAPE